MRRVLVPEAPRGLRRAAAPTFSILVPAYQAADSIAECIDSALAQTVPAHEVIVVDDGSTDATGEVLNRYQGRIVHLHQENRGVAGALNAGVANATGDFVSILDADDVYEPQRLEALAELAAERPDLDILMTDAYVEVDGEIVGLFGERTPFVTDRQSVAIFEDCFIAWPAVRRTRLVELGGFDESLRIGEDWECWIRLLHAGCRAGSVGEPLMRYRVKGARSLTDDRVAALQSRVRVLELAARLDLSEEQRAELERFRERRSRRVLLAEAERALRGHDPDARLRSLRVARAEGMPLATRLLALAASLAPRLAGRTLAAIEARTGHTRLKRPVLRRTQFP